MKRKIVGDFHDAPAAAPRPAYRGAKTGKAWHADRMGPLRLIYYDPVPIADVVGNLGSSERGRSLLRSSDLIDGNGNVLDRNPRILLLRLMASMNGHGVVDPEFDELRQVEDFDLHPNQVVVARGRVRAANDVMPSSVRLEVGSASMSILVDKNRFLHHNKSYLTASAITVIGVVRSVPRCQIRAAGLASSPAMPVMSPPESA